MATSLRGRTALITGAAHRIGRQIALTLARDGVNIVVHYHRSAGDADATAEAVRALGVQAWTLSADLAQRDACITLFDEAVALAGPLQILVNNASIFPQDRLETLTWESLADNMQVNAWAPLVLLRAFFAHNPDGKVINLHDSRLVGYDWSHASYILSKHVLAEITRMAALHYAPRGTVNAVAPGLILPPPGQDVSYLERLVDTVPLKRYGNAQEIADAVLFLLQSDFITGEVIYVDGGRHLKETLHAGPHPY